MLKVPDYIIDSHTALLLFEKDDIALPSVWTFMRVVTKLLQPLVKSWRGHGLKVVIYLNDGICSVPADRAEAANELIKITLEQAGFVAHPVKSQWTPSYQVLWLGFDIDLLNLMVLFWVPKKNCKS